MHRLHCVLLAESGLSCREVAAYFADSPRSVQRWVRRYERIGIEALRDRRRSGRPSRLTAEQRLSLAAAVQQRPSSGPGADQGPWTGPRLRAHILSEFGVMLSVRHCQRLLRLIDGPCSVN